MSRILVALGLVLVCSSFASAQAGSDDKAEDLVRYCESLVKQVTRTLPITRSYPPIKAATAQDSFPGYWIQTHS
jgi:hypothetical protein